MNDVIPFDPTKQHETRSPFGRRVTRKQHEENGKLLCAQRVQLHGGGGTARSRGSQNHPRHSLGRIRFKVRALEGCGAPFSVNSPFILLLPPECPPFSNAMFQATIVPASTGAGSQRGATLCDYYFSHASNAMS